MSNYFVNAVQDFGKSWLKFDSFCENLSLENYMLVIICEPFGSWPICEANDIFLSNLLIPRIYLLMFFIICFFAFTQFLGCGEECGCLWWGLFLSKNKNDM